MVDVFLSYKREERAHANMIAASLKALGYSVWWDADLLPGARFAEETTAMLDQAKVVVVLWSGAAARSEFVCSEARRANRRGAYVPVSIDGAEPPLGLDERQCISLAGWAGDPEESAVQPLWAAIRQRVETATGPGGVGADAARRASAAGVAGEATVLSSPPEVGRFIGENITGMTFAASPGAWISSVTPFPDGRIWVGQTHVKSTAEMLFSSLTGLGKDYERILQLDPRSRELREIRRIDGGGVIVSASPDGRNVAIFTENKFVHILTEDRDVAPIKTFLFHRLTCAGWSSDSKTFMIADRESGTLFDFRRLFAPWAWGCPIRAPFIYDRSNKIWLFASGSAIRSYNPDSDDADPAVITTLRDAFSIESMSISPDGRYLLLILKRGSSEARTIQLRSMGKLELLGETKQNVDISLPGRESHAWIADNLLVLAGGGLRILSAPDLDEVYYVGQMCSHTAAQTFDGRTRVFSWFSGELDRVEFPAVRLR
jgi:hypothetical protein